MPAVTEAMHFLGDVRGGREILCDMIADGAVQLLHVDAAEMPRIKQLMRKYSDRPMDFADAALVRVAEREGLTRILTFDADFAIYRLPAGQDSPSCRRLAGEPRPRERSPSRRCRIPRIRDMLVSVSSAQSVALLLDPLARSRSVPPRATSGLFRAFSGMGAPLRLSRSSGSAAASGDTSSTTRCSGARLVTRGRAAAGRHTSPRTAPPPTSGTRSPASCGTTPTCASSDRDGVHEYVCVRCGHPLVYPETHDPFAGP